MNPFNLKQAPDQCGPEAEAESEGAICVDWIHFVWEDFPVEGGFLPAMAVRGLVERRGVRASLPRVSCVLGSPPPPPPCNPRAGGAALSCGPHTTRQLPGS